MDENTINEAVQCRHRHTNQGTEPKQELCGAHTTYYTQRGKKGKCAAPENEKSLGFIKM